eukprot:TRINITY_DN45289_c0_g1_i1.p1 TRINITY_DN45289_c0_g1~~TRINITY_DN45289_c0_g1_i1.p1  ORF type:complete len:399 (-),score=129.42 TRINITY_DN45289_c0_g1_i1:276-1472(-)
MTQAVGGTLGAYFGTVMASGMVLGISGWRVAFFIIAAISVVTGALLWSFGKDVPAGGSDTDPQQQQQQQRLSCTRIRTEFAEVLQVRSFQIILAQGMVGSMPWFAMAFMTMWLEESCFSNHAAALIWVAFNVGKIFAGFLGGWVVDSANKWNSRHGRIYAAQFSVGVGLPLFFIVFYILPAGKAPWLISLVLFMTGALISWCGIVNNSIFAEIVHPKNRSTIYSLDRAIEGATASLGSLLVGVLADQVFGFEGDSDSPGGGHRSGTATTEKDPCNLDNADALGNALMVTMGVPWLLCFLAYTALHLTYGDDRDACASFFKGEEAVEVEMEAVALEEDDEEKHSIMGGVGLDQGIEAQMGKFEEVPPDEVNILKTETEEDQHEHEQLTGEKQDHEEKEP